MRQAAVLLSGLLLLILPAPCLSPTAASILDAGTQIESSGGAPLPFHCTVFTVSKEGRVFFGGNDDYVNPDSYYWVDPGGGDHYGAIWVGQPDNVQQGVNEHGLAYDASGLPRVDVNAHSERTPVSGDYTSYPIHILHECATVVEVIAWVSTHQWHSYMHDQMQFADATGDAVVISAGRDGELAFTRKPPGDGFLVSTNFNVANPSNGFSYPCWRYNRARESLGRLVSQEGELTAEDAAGVLEAVHQHGATGWTISSLVADLPNGVVYLYYFYQFDRPVVLHVQEELADPRTPGPLSELFPEDARLEATRRYSEIQAQARRCRSAATGWLIIDVACLVVLLFLYRRERSGLRFWLPAVLFLGPLALLVRFAAGRHRQSSTWRATLLEALGDIVPTVVVFVVVLVITVQVQAVQSAQLLQLFMWLCLPLLVGWSAFHAPLLAGVTEGTDGHFMRRRLPQALVVANMGLGGISMVAMPLVRLSLRTCPVLPLTVWTILTWWLITVIGAVTGGLLICLYERWAVRAGFRAWSVLARGEGSADTPSWRRLWWWVLTSYVTLFVGIAVGAIL